MLVVNRSIFAAALRDVLPATVGKTVLPILSNVLLTNNGKELTIIGTNLEYTISITMDCVQCDLPDIVIEARLLQAWLANQNSEEVSLTAHDSYVLLQAGKSKTKVMVLSADEFPGIVEQVGNALSVDPFDLANCLVQTVHAVSSNPNETRNYARGVFVELREHSLLFTGLDGFRMIHREMPVTDGSDTVIGVMPQRCILALVKLLANAENNVELVYDANKAMALSFNAKPYNKVYFRTQLIETKYPDYRGIVPKSYDLCMVLPKNDLVRAINNCLLFAADNSNRTCYEMDSAGTFLKAQSATLGEHEDYINAVSVTGGIDTPFALNGKYVLEWLRTVNTDNIQFECQNNNARPVTLRDADLPKNGYAVIMPMQLQ